MKLFKKVLIGALTLGILFFVGLYTYLYFAVLENPFDNKEFNRTVWISMNDDMNPDNPRGEMYDDLVENHLSKGMKKSEVLSLLGKPDFKNEEKFISYNLGMWSGLRIDYDSLDLEFSDSGELKKFYRVQH